MVAPGVTKARSHSDALVESVDLYPTLCQLAGLPAPQVPQQLDGVSLEPLLRRKTFVKKKEAVFHAYPRNPREKGNLIGRSVRTERYRLVEWKRPGAAPETADLELYDYKSDPEETKNLAREKPKVVAQLRAILAKQPEAKPQFRSPQ
jgi:iduronate 2-sulfatase